MPKITLRNVTSSLCRFVTSELTVVMRAIISRELPMFLNCLLRYRRLSGAMRQVLQITRCVRRRITFATVRAMNHVILSLPRQARNSFRTLPIKRIYRLLRLVGTRSSVSTFDLNCLF